MEVVLPSMLLRPFPRVLPGSSPTGILHCSYAMADVKDGHAGVACWKERWTGESFQYPELSPGPIPLPRGLQGGAWCPEQGSERQYDAAGTPRGGHAEDRKSCHLNTTPDSGQISPGEDGRDGQPAHLCSEARRQGVQRS